MAAAAAGAGAGDGVSPVIHWSLPRPLLAGIGGRGVLLRNRWRVAEHGGRAV